MKLAFVSTMLATPAWGGADVLWTRTAAAALGAGHQVLISVTPVTAIHARIAALQAAGAQVRLRTHPTHRRGRRSGWQQRLARIIGRRGSVLADLDRFQPDCLVLCQGGTFDFLNEDGLVAWLGETGCACVPICQSNDDREVLSPAHQAAARRFFATARATIFVSSHNRDLAGRQAGAPVPRAAIVVNPAEISVTVPPAWPADPIPRLAVVARLDTDSKGLDVLLDAVGRLPSAAAWTLSIYGRGPDEPALRARVRELGLAERISFAGFAPDVRDVWARHHLLVLPSRREGCALALLEALACGRPVLTTETGGARDWIEPGVNGWICAVGDAAALAATLARALEEFPRWPAAGAAARRIFETRHPTAPEAQLLALIQPAA